MKSTGTVVTVVIVNGVSISNRTRSGRSCTKERRSYGRKSAGTIVDAHKMSAVGTVKKGSTGSEDAESSSCIVMPKGQSHPR